MVKPKIQSLPQESVLGPILFLIFINDLTDNIKSSVRLFADNCVLYRNIHSLQDCLILQEDALWESDWQMKFNDAKSHSMRMTRIIRKTNPSRLHTAPRTAPANLGYVAKMTI